MIRLERNIWSEKSQVSYFSRELNELTTKGTGGVKEFGEEIIHFFS